MRPIEAFPVETSGQQAIGIRDPYNFAEQTLVVPHNVFFIISHFDGNHSILDIQAKYSQQYGDLLISDNVHKIIKELDSHLFLENDRARDHIQKIKDDFRDSDIRKASHAGAAYDADTEKLTNTINAFFTSEDGPGEMPSLQNKTDKLKGVIAPHIDLRCGGPCFAWSYKEIAESSDADLFIIFGVAHSGAKNLFSLTSKTFETPFGPVETDKEFFGSLQERFKFDYLEDEYAHKNEHSIEFQLIFLQHLYRQKKDFKIIPILCSSFGHILGDKDNPLQVPIFENFVTSLKEAIGTSKKKVCLIASVDLAHVGQRFGDEGTQDDAYLQRIGEEDVDLLKYVEKVDAEGFYNSIQKDNDKRRTCGFPAIYTMLNVMNASEGKLLKYSQNIDANTHSTVTFASMAFYYQYLT